MDVDPSAAVTAVNAASGIAGQISIVVISLISTAAMLWKTSRDQRHALEMMRLQAELAAADRREQAANAQAERERKAAEIRERMLIDTSNMQSSIHATSLATVTRLEGATQEIKDDSRNVTALQTIELKTAVEQAKQYMAARAEAAYKESNDVNTKLKALHEAHERGFVIMEQLLTTLNRAFPESQKKEVGK